jgi:enoyl-CoA hydratase/carnithine racemase
MNTELTLNPGLAEELKALRREEAYDGGPVVVDALDGAGAVEGTADLPAAIDRFSAPVVLAASGPLDAIALALCCACTLSYIGPDAELAAIDPADALSLGLAGRLTERLGPGAAARMLLDTRAPSQPVHAVAPDLAIAAEDPLAAARDAAARLAEPAAALLPRSLAFAARSTRAQSAAYDSELLALLTDPRERPR